MNVKSFFAIDVSAYDAEVILRIFGTLRSFFSIDDFEQEGRELKRLPSITNNNTYDRRLKVDVTGLTLTEKM